MIYTRERILDLPNYDKGLVEGDFNITIVRGRGVNFKIIKEIEEKNQIELEAKRHVTNGLIGQVTIYNGPTKVRVVGRKTYPTKTYSTASFYSRVEHLPTSSYYSIKDAVTEETIVPYNDTYTKISCDSTGNYFNIRFNGLLPERTYRFCIKTVNDGGDNTRYHDNGYYFKVVR